MNYRADSDSLLTATSLLEKLQSTCAEREEFALTPAKLGVRMCYYTISKVEQTNIQTNRRGFLSDVTSITSYCGAHLTK